MSELTVIPTCPEELSLKVSDSSIVDESKFFLIKTDEDVLIAKGLRSQLKARIAFVMDDPSGPRFAENINNAHKLHKSLVAAAKVFTDPCNDAVGIIDTNIGKFDQEKRQLKELADKQAREDQEKERQKVMIAAQAKIDRAMKSTGKIETQITEMQAIADDLLATDEARTLAARQIEILRLQLESQQAQAAAIQKTAEQAMDALPVASLEAMAYTKTAGVKTSNIVEVLDKLALIKLVADGKAPESIFDVNEGKLKALIKGGIKFPTDIVKVTEESKYGGRG